MPYLSVAQVDTTITALAAAYPSTAALITLPHVTPEGRTCHALRLGGGAPGSRDCVMVIGGVHAREWGSCEIAVSFAADLLEAFAGGLGLAYGGKSYSASQIQSVMNTLHVVVFPLVNPDGREFSQQQQADWRRNRNPAQSGGNPSCIGVDLNRNFDFLFDFQTKFAPSSPGQNGASTDPCHGGQVYHGPSAFSEPETQNVRWLLDAHPRTHWFLDLHSAGQRIYVNWGSDENQSIDPDMNFQNPAFDSVRGISGDTAYKEYMPADDATVAMALITQFRDALQAVRGTVYVIEQTIGNSGTSKDYVYARHFLDPSKSKIYGYTVEWGQEFQPPSAEMDLIVQDVSAGLIAYCLAAPCAGGLTAVGLLNPTITFNDVPAGVETSRAAVFSVQTCGAVELAVTANPTVTTGPGSFGLPMGSGSSLPSAPSAIARPMWIWVSFRGTNPGDVTQGSITIRCPQSNQNFVVPIFANTIAQPKVASILALDKSGSMAGASGIPGKVRMDVLHDSAPSYVTLLPNDAGIGLVAFDHDATPVMPVTPAGPQGVMGGGRDTARTGIGNHQTNPAGLTAIGDGVELAHNTLQPLAGYDHKAIVVFTDGFDTANKTIDEVAGIIGERVFAIGLGTVNEVNPVALNRLVNNTGGYLLMTDALGPNDRLRLDKYFVQILAGVTNAEIVVDPEGIVTPGIEVKIPFDLNSNDYAGDAITLSPAPGAFEFELETPAGTRVDHQDLSGVSGVEYVTGPHLGFYRFTLPMVVRGVGAHEGRWHVVLNLRRFDPRLAMSVHGVPYSVIVQARSSLVMGAWVTQPSNVPPTTLNLRATLTEIGLPVDHRAHVRADVTRPDTTQVSIDLVETDPGVFEGSTPAPLAGVYPVHFQAWGHTLRGYPFTREQLRTGMAWHPGRVRPGDPAPHRPWAGLLRGLLAQASVRRWLEAQQIDPREVLRSVDHAFPDDD